MKRSGLHRIEAAPPAIAGGGGMTRQRNGRFDWTLQARYSPPLTESGVVAELRRSCPTEHGVLAEKHRRGNAASVLRSWAWTATRGSGSMDRAIR